MHPLLTTLPTLAVSVLFCLWRKYHEAQSLRRRRLRERVAYMLWVMVDEVGSDVGSGEVERVRV